MNDFIDLEKVYDHQTMNVERIDLSPNYRLENETVKITQQVIKFSEPTEEESKRNAEIERKTIMRREKNFKEGINFYDSFQKLDIELIGDTPAGWNLFDKPTQYELNDLIRSVESIGLLNPIYVLRRTNGDYNVICGRSRVLAFLNLYQSTNLEQFRYIPSYIVDETYVDELFIRTMIIESNISFRTISKPNLIQSLITNYEIMRRTKLYRSQTNVAEEIAKTFNVSQTSVFNYLKVRELCNEAQTLLYEDRIKLKAASYLAKVSKETQKNILERFGIKGVNTIFKLKLITEDGNVSTEILDKKIKDLENYTPPKTRMTIEIRREFLAQLIDCLLEFKKEVIVPFACRSTRGKTSTIFKVNYNSEDMEHYIKENKVDEKSLKRILAKSVSELAKLK